MPATIDKAEVLASLTPMAVLARFAISARITGAELRFAICPECGPRTRADAVSINQRTGRWYCHVGGCSGDLLAMVAGFAGIDIERDFPRVLEVAATVAGIA